MPRNDRLADHSDMSEGPIMPERPAQRVRTGFLRRAGSVVLLASLAGAAFGVTGAATGWWYLEGRARNETTAIADGFVEQLKTAAEKEELDEWFYGLLGRSGITLDEVASVVAENGTEEQDTGESELAQPPLTDQQVDTFVRRIDDPRFRTWVDAEIEDATPEEIANWFFGPEDTVPELAEQQ